MVGSTIVSSNMQRVYKRVQFCFEMKQVNFTTIKSKSMVVTAFELEKNMEGGNRARI